MTKYELEQEKKNNKEAITLIENNIEAMEQTIEIQNYLDELERKKTEEAKQVFLNSLTLGEDGTIFGPKGDNRYVLYMIDEFIKYAFSLKYYTMNPEETHSMQISFRNLVEYKKAVTKTLQEMKKYPDEKPKENIYGLEVYSNPKELVALRDSATLLNCIFAPSIHSLKDELKLCLMDEVVVLNVEDNQEKGFLIISDFLHSNEREFSEFEPVDIITLSMREKNAFFGEEAQKALGVTMDTALFTKPQDNGTIKKAPYTK